MPNDDRQVRTRSLSWDEICRKAWGKDWTSPTPAYDFTGRRFYDHNDGGGVYRGADVSVSLYADDYADNYYSGAAVDASVYYEAYADLYA